MKFLKLEISGNPQKKEVVNEQTLLTKSTFVNRKEKNIMRKLTLMIATMLLCAYLPLFSSILEETDAPVITVSTDKEEYTMFEDKIDIFLEVSNPGEAIDVDIIFALYHQPAGSLEGKLWFFPNWTERYQFISLTLPSGFTLKKTKILEVDVPAMVPGTPPFTEAGEYIWAFAFAEPGTLNFIGDISTAVVNVRDVTIPTN